MEDIIKVKNLVKKYGETAAVNDISFEVKKGEIFAFLGPNGAGKSTTIKMMTTLLRPTSGEISVNGADPQKEQDEVRKSFGIVFQDPSTDDELTAWENMYFHAVLYRVPAAKAKRRIEELLNLTDLWDRRSSLVKTFSGGMKPFRNRARPPAPSQNHFFGRTDFGARSPDPEPNLGLYQKYE